MATMAEISAAIALINTKKQNLQDSFLHLQSQTPSSFNLPINWADLDSHFTTIQSSLISKFNLLQTLHPPSQLHSLCHNSDGLGLTRFIAQSPDYKNSILTQLVEAYRSAPDAPGMVLDAVASFYGSGFKGAELRSFRIACTIMLDGLGRLKPDVTNELKDKAMVMAVQWNKFRVSNCDRLKPRVQEVLGWLYLVGAYGIVDRFSIDVFVDCFLILGTKSRAIKLCRRIVPPDKVKDVIQKFIDSDRHVKAVKYSIELQKTDDFAPVRLLEEMKLKSMMVIEEVRRDVKDLSVRGKKATLMREIMALKSIIKCVNMNHLESEYPTDSLVELVKRLENEVEDSKQTPGNDQPANTAVLKQQPPSESNTSKKSKKRKRNNVQPTAESVVATPVQSVQSVQVSLSQSSDSSPDHVDECHNSPLGSGLAGPFAPSSDPTSVPDLPKLKSFCENSDGLGLNRFIALATDKKSILSELPDAYRCAPDAPAMVLDAVASFYRSGFEGGELRPFRSSCSIMLDGLVRLKPDITSELKDKAMEMAVRWKPIRVSTPGNKEQEVQEFLYLVGAFGLMDRFSINDIIDCFLIVARKPYMIDLCRRILPANNINDLIQKLVDKDRYLTAVKYSIELQKTGEFTPVGLLEELKLRSMMVIEETRRGVKDLRVRDATIMREISVLKSIIKCIKKNRLESEYPTDSLVELVKRLENEVENSKQTPVNDQPASIAALKMQSPSESNTLKKSKKRKLNNVQPTAESVVETPVPSVQSVQEFHSQNSDLSPNYVDECHNSPLGSALAGPIAPSSDPTSVLDQPELKSFCKNSDGLGLNRFIALAPSRPSILDELTDAYRFAPDAPAMVLDAMVVFYSPGCEDGIELCLFRNACLIMMEGLLRVKPDITVEVKDKAMEMALQWNQKRVICSGEQEALGFLLLVGAYGLIDLFSIDDITDCVLIVVTDDDTIDLCRRIIPANNTIDMIKKLVDKKMFSVAVKCSIELQKTDVFPPVGLLEEWKLRSGRVLQEKRTNAKYLDVWNDATRDGIKDLEGIIKCIVENQLESAYPKDSLVELVNKLKNELENSKHLKGLLRKQPLRAKSKMLEKSKRMKKSKKPKLNQFAAATTVHSVQESRLDHVGDCHVSPLGPGSDAPSANDNTVELVNKLPEELENSKQTRVNNLVFRKQPLRATVLKQQLLSKFKRAKKSRRLKKSKKPILNKVQPPAESAVSISTQKESRSQKSTSSPDHVGECHVSALGLSSSGSDAPSAKDNAVELVNKLGNEVENSKQTLANEVQPTAESAGAAPIPSVEWIQESHSRNSVLSPNYAGDCHNSPLGSVPTGSKALSESLKGSTAADIDYTFYAPQLQPPSDFHSNGWISD